MRRSRTAGIPSAFYRRGSLFLHILSCVLAVALFAGVLYLRPRIITQVSNLLDAAGETAASTQAGLDLVAESLDTAGDSLDELQSSVLTLQQSLHAMDPMLSDVGSLIGDDFVQITRETQASMDAASQSAKVIDGFLGTLARLRFLGVVYDPEVPLSESLGTLADNFGALPDGLKSVQKQLDTTAGQVAFLAEDVGGLNDQISGFEASLLAAKPILSEYQSQLDVAAKQLIILRDKTPFWINLISSLFLLAFAIRALTELLAIRELFQLDKSGTIPAGPGSATSRSDAGPDSPNDPKGE